MAKVQIEREMRVTVRTAFGDWIEKVATSGVERGHSFPVVWAARPEEWEAAQADGREPEAVPWPAEDVKAVVPE